MGYYATFISGTVVVVLSFNYTAHNNSVIVVNQPPQSAFAGDNFRTTVSSTVSVIPGRNHRGSVSLNSDLYDTGRIFPGIWQNNGTSCFTP